MPLLVHDTVTIGELAHSVWGLLSHAKEPRKPKHSYEDVMNLFRSLHLAQIAAYAMDGEHAEHFILRSYEPRFLVWFERPGSQFQPRPDAVELVSDLFYAWRNTITEEGINFMPAIYEKKMKKIIEYAASVAGVPNPLNSFELV